MLMFGKTVVDATRKKSITITAPDIANAIAQDDHNCAVAQAVRREKGVTGVSVGNSVVYVTYSAKPKEIVRYNISPNDRAMIKEFDKQGAFPCGYKVTLLPIPKSRRLGARAGEAQGTNKRSGKGNNALHRAARDVPTRHVSEPI